MPCGSLGLCRLLYPTSTYQLTLGSWGLRSCLSHVNTPRKYGENCLHSLWLGAGRVPPDHESPPEPLGMGEAVLSGKVWPAYSCYVRF